MGEWVGGGKGGECGDCGRSGAERDVRMEGRGGKRAEIEIFCLGLNAGSAVQRLAVIPRPLRKYGPSGQPFLPIFFIP